MATGRCRSLRGPPGRSRHASSTESFESEVEAHARNKQQPHGSTMREPLGNSREFPQGGDRLALGARLGRQAPATLIDATSGRRYQPGRRRLHAGFSPPRRAVLVKFSIANLGRIQDAPLDIKPLTVFLGKNGTHKTWALNCLHGLLSDRADMNAVRPRIGDGQQAALREITERAVAGLSDGRERHAFPRGQVLNAFGTEVTFVIEHMIASFVGVHVAGRATLVQPTADLRSEGLLTVTRSGRLGTDLEIGTDEESIVLAGVPSDPIELSTFLSYWVAGIATRRRARVYVLPAERLGFPSRRRAGTASRAAGAH
ncbi:hypothetical protein OUZ56_032507 [Daphnia magna]|uniref:AAA domain-containing protein n=1 Tax=Daphnia magna TaxID=35525 RepID=A0ABR0B936_9CRUS|nr:hypothetical protein OUZ56_032507 [Daphnia magna]